MNWIVRADVFVLALMFAYTVAVFVRVFSLYSLARRSRIADATCQKHMDRAVDLSKSAVNLKSIAAAAPYLGLAGTCVGLMTAFRGVGMEKHAAMAMMMSDVAATLVTTAVGIFVAVPATCLYNYICVCLESELPNEAVASRNRGWQPGKFPLAKQFSALPAFGITAAPGLAASIAVFAMFYSYASEPTGLVIDLVSTRCEFYGDDRPIILHITDTGKVFLNQEQKDWSSLAPRLSEIFSTGIHRNLYLLADDGVAFQTVADAIDIAEKAPVAESADLQNITVRLITPAAAKACCFEPVVGGSKSHASR